MSPTRKAAVDRDILEKPLAEINAFQFLEVLHEARVSPAVMAILPDKKKFELWVEEGRVEKIPVGTLLERIRREKKKLELEKRLIVEHFPKHSASEFEVDPERLIDPEIREGLVNEIVEEVVRRVGR